LNQTDLIDLAKIQFPDVPIVDLFPSHPLPEALALLSKIGISEAWSYLRLPGELSDGQRWRLKIALAIEQAKASPAGILICDEFAALLDRLTARIISHRLGRWIRQHSLRAIFVSAHDDLSKPLNPAIQIRCDFSRLTLARRNGRTAQTGGAR
jgi:ABC-type ATPase with predicted acetyltransferase domain